MSGNQTLRRIAVFGGNGYLGCHLSAHLLAKGVLCDVFDVQQTSLGKATKYVRADVTSSEFWNSFDFQVYETIYFFSGLSGPERSFKEAFAYNEINEVGLLNLCRKLAPHGKDAPKIIFPSSRLVYRGGMRVSEDSPLEARSIYAANKIACENILSAYHHRYGIQYAALRICVPYGNMVGTAYSYGTIGFFLKCIKENRPVTVYGDGSNRKTYTFISDLCVIADRISAREVASGVYNVGGYDYSLMEVAMILSVRFGGSVKKVPWPDAALRVEMGDISLDSTKLDRAIRFDRYERFEDVVSGSILLN